MDVIGLELWTSMAANHHHYSNQGVVNQQKTKASDWICADEFDESKHIPRQHVVASGV
jgi:hypothetical protein